jgi:hypothetical protein
MLKIQRIILCLAVERFTIFGRLQFIIPMCALTLVGEDDFSLPFVAAFAKDLLLQAFVKVIL